MNRVGGHPLIEWPTSHDQPRGRGETAEKVPFSPGKGRASYVNALATPKGVLRKLGKRIACAIR